VTLYSAAIRCGFVSQIRYTDQETATAVDPAGDERLDEVYFCPKTAILRFRTPPFLGRERTGAYRQCSNDVCAVHLLFILGSHVVDFLLVIIELLLLGVTAEAL